MTARKKARLQVLEHPLAQSFLTDIRDHRTGRAVVRDRVRALAMMLFLEASRDLPQSPKPVRTPLVKTVGTQITAKVGLVPILRAGLGMVEGVLEVIPEARVFHLGLYRNEQTLEAVEYYNKLHHHRPVDIAFILDPMLATGGSAVMAVERLKSWGVKQIKFLGLFAAPAGVRHLHEKHPEVAIHIATLDSHLNARGYIVPGCGDAGDRQFSAE